MTNLYPRPSISSSLTIKRDRHLLRATTISISVVLPSASWNRLRAIVKLTI